MSEDWERARQAVRDEVAARGVDSKAGIAAMLGVSEATWHRFNSGKTGRPWMRTMNAIEDGLGWSRGRLERIARGVEQPATRPQLRQNPRSREVWRAKMPDLPDDEFEDVWDALVRRWVALDSDPGRTTNQDREHRNLGNGG